MLFGTPSLLSFQFFVIVFLYLYYIHVSNYIATGYVKEVEWGRGTSGERERKKREREREHYQWLVEVESHLRGRWGWAREKGRELVQECDTEEETE